MIVYVKISRLPFSAFWRFREARRGSPVDPSGATSPRSALRQFPFRREDELAIHPPRKPQPRLARRLVIYHNEMAAIADFFLLHLPNPYGRPYRRAFPTKARKGFGCGQTYAPIPDRAPGRLAYTQSPGVASCDSSRISVFPDARSVGVVISNPAHLSSSSSGAVLRRYWGENAEPHAPSPERKRQTRGSADPWSRLNAYPNNRRPKEAVNDQGRDRPYAKQRRAPPPRP